jgi:hypothetical protein
MLRDERKYKKEYNLEYWGDIGVFIVSWARTPYVSGNSIFIYLLGIKHRASHMLIIIIINNTYNFFLLFSWDRVLLTQCNSNSWISCLSLPSTGITGLHHPCWAYY